MCHNTRMRKKWCQFLITVAILLGSGLIGAPSVRASLRLNEIYATPESGQSEWLEIYNPTDQAVDLADWQIAELTSGTIKNFENLTAFEATLAAQSFLVIEPKKLTLNNGGDTIYLFYRDQQIDAVEYPKLTKDQSCARLPDGTGQWQIVTSITPGSSNVVASDDQEASSSDQIEQTDRADSVDTTTTVSAAASVNKVTSTTKSTSATSNSAAVTKTTTTNNGNATSARDNEDLAWQNGLTFALPKLTYSQPSPANKTIAASPPVQPDREASVAGVYTNLPSSEYNHQANLGVLIGASGVIIIAALGYLLPDVLAYDEKRKISAYENPQF